MAKLVLLSDLVTLCKQKADAESDGHITEWKSLISDYYAVMHALVTEAGARYFETEQTINANGAAGGAYALPADHLSTVGVDFVFDSAGRRRELAELMAPERTDWIGEIGEAYGYQLVGQNLVLFPSPTTGTYKHVYAPQPTDLSTAIDATQVDVINIWGQRFIVWGAASDAKHKSESDQRRAIMERDNAKTEIAIWAYNRAAQFAAKRPTLGAGRRDPATGVYRDPADWTFR